MQSEEIDVISYFAREPDPERTLLALVGDLHRIIVYPHLRFQIEQEVPGRGERCARAPRGGGLRRAPGAGARLASNVILLITHYCLDIQC